MDAALQEERTNTTANPGKLLAKTSEAVRKVDPAAMEAALREQRNKFSCEKGAT